MNASISPEHLVTSMEALEKLYAEPFGPSLVKERARRLRAKGAAALRAHLDTEVGRTRRVLAESERLGRSEHYTLVGLNAAVETGMVVDVIIKGHDGRQLLAA